MLPFHMTPKQQSAWIMWTLQRLWYWSVTIKIASTWEGIQAAKVLEALPVTSRCFSVYTKHKHVQSDFNLTICRPYFRLVQKGVDAYPIEKDPGVVSVKKLTTSSKIFQLKWWVRASGSSAWPCRMWFANDFTGAQLEQDTRTVDAALDATKSQRLLLDLLKMKKALKTNWLNGIPTFTRWCRWLY